MNKEHIEHCWG